jgi:hypothetical protein
MSAPPPSPPPPAPGPSVSPPPPSTPCRAEPSGSLNPFATPFSPFAAGSGHPSGGELPSWLKFSPSSSSSSKSERPPSRYSVKGKAPVDPAEGRPRPVVPAGPRSGASSVRVHGGCAPCPGCSGLPPSPGARRARVAACHSQEEAHLEAFASPAFAPAGQSPGGFAWLVLQLLQGGPCCQGPPEPLVLLPLQRAEPPGPRLH